jgi:alpha-beta hydrolase superfamily lysophospholipase
MSETTGTFVTSDGTELFTRTVTPETPRYDILIVHGLAEHSGRWSEPAAQFAASGAVVHMLDLRGHGQSGGSEMHVEDFPVFGDDVAQFAAASAAASGRPWILYGHSMGALICTGYLIDERSPMPNAAVISRTPYSRRWPVRWES